MAINFALDRAIRASGLIPRHLYVAAVSWVSQVLLAVVQLMIIPVLSVELGADSYAVFAIMTSLVLWFSLADFSLGYSVQNFVSEARAKGESYDEYVFNTFFLGILLLSILSITLIYFSPLLGDRLLSKFTFIDSADRALLFLVVALFFTVTAISNIAYKIWFAEHKGYLSNSFPAFASIVGFLVIYKYVPSLESNKLLFVLSVYSASPCLVALLVFVSRFIAVARGKVALSKVLIRKLAKRALMFWGLVLMASMVVQADYLVMSQVLTPTQIVTYSIATKIFGLFFVCYGAVLNALWPVFSEALVRGNVTVVQSYINRYVFFSIVLVILYSAVLAIFMPYISAILMPGITIVIPTSFIMLLAGYYILRVWSDMYAMVLNSISKLRVMWLYMPVQALLSVGLQFYLASIFGIYGIVIGLMASFVLTAAWILPYEVRRNFKLISNVIRKDLDV